MDSTDNAMPSKPLIFMSVQWPASDPQQRAGKNGVCLQGLALLSSQCKAFLTRREQRVVVVAEIHVPPKKLSQAVQKETSHRFEDHTFMRFQWNSQDPKGR